MMLYRERMMDDSRQSQANVIKIYITRAVDQTKDRKLRKKEHLAKKRLVSDRLVSLKYNLHYFRFKSQKRAS